MRFEISLPAELRAAFDRQMSLCDDLEELADSLPRGADRQTCLHLSRLIGSLIKQAHVTEESLLFPAIATLHDQGDALIQSLRLEHMEDECFAEEVQYELLQMGQGNSVLAPETTGDMLRGFFDGIRRHVRYEIELFATVKGGSVTSVAP